MERGTGFLLVLLVVALVLGAAVLLGHPAYRRSVAAVWRGEPGAGPLWQSNRTYYPAVALPERISPDDPA